VQNHDSGSAEDDSNLVCDIIEQSVGFITENKDNVKVLLLEILKDWNNALSYGLELKGLRFRGMDSIVLIHSDNYFWMDGDDPYIQFCVQSAAKKIKSSKVVECSGSVDEGAFSTSDANLVDHSYVVPLFVRGAAYSKGVRDILVKCNAEMQSRDRLIAQQQERIIALENYIEDSQKNANRHTPRPKKHRAAGRFGEFTDRFQMSRVMSVICREADTPRKREQIIEQIIKKDNNGRSYLEDKSKILIADSVISYIKFVHALIQFQNGSTLPVSINWQDLQNLLKYLVFVAMPSANHSPLIRELMGFEHRSRILEEAWDYQHLRSRELINKNDQANPRLAKQQKRKRSQRNDGPAHEIQEPVLVPEETLIDNVIADNDVVMGDGEDDHRQENDRNQRGEPEHEDTDYWADCNWCTKWRRIKHPLDNDVLYYCDNRELTLSASITQCASPLEDGAEDDEPSLNDVTDWGQCSVCDQWRTLSRSLSKKEERKYKCSDEVTRLKRIRDKGCTARPEPNSD
jgi:hypothetical protein